MCISVKAHRLNKLPLATALTWLTAMCFILSEWDGASTLHNSPANPLWIRNGSFSWSCTHEQVTRGKHSLVTFRLAPTHILYHLQPSSPELLGRHSMTEATGLNGERLCTVHPALHRHDVMMTSSHTSPSPQGERLFPTGEDPWGVKLPQPCICSLDNCVCPCLMFAMQQWATVHHHYTQMSFIRHHHTYWRYAMEVHGATEQAITVWPQELTGTAIKVENSVPLPGT